MWEIEGEGIKKRGATHGVRFWRNRMNQGKGTDGRGGLKQTNKNASSSKIRAKEVRIDEECRFVRVEW